MSKKRVSSMREGVCCVCGERFLAAGNRKVYCDQCRKNKKAEHLKHRNEGFKKPKVIAHYRPAADVGIIKMVRIIDRYNAEHGTHYSYGKFVQMIEAKKINFSKVTQDARLSAQG